MKKAGANVTRIDNTLQCAIAIDKGSNACYGDSGSPSMVTRNGKIVIVGLSVYIPDSCAPLDSQGNPTPSQFAKVSAVSHWIKTTLCSLGGKC